MSTQHWSPQIILSINPSSPTFHCIGKTKKNLPCHNTINPTDRSEAESILEDLAATPLIWNHKPQLTQLACVTLCSHWHRQHRPAGDTKRPRQPQVTETVLQWSRMIRVEIERLERARESGGRVDVRRLRQVEDVSVAVIPVGASSYRVKTEPAMTVTELQREVEELRREMEVFQSRRVTAESNPSSNPCVDSRNDVFVSRPNEIPRPIEAWSKPATIGQEWRDRNERTHSLIGRPANLLSTSGHNIASDDHRPVRLARLETDKRQRLPAIRTTNADDTRQMPSLALDESPLSSISTRSKYTEDKKRILSSTSNQDQSSPAITLPTAPENRKDKLTLTNNPSNPSTIITRMTIAENRRQSLTTTVDHNPPDPPIAKCPLTPTRRVPVRNSVHTPPTTPAQTRRSNQISSPPTVPIRDLACLGLMTPPDSNTRPSSSTLQNLTSFSPEFSFDLTPSPDPMSTPSSTARLLPKEPRTVPETPSPNPSSTGPLLQPHSPPSTPCPSKSKSKPETQVHIHAISPQIILEEKVTYCRAKCGRHAHNGWGEIWRDTDVEMLEKEEGGVGMWQGMKCSVWWLLLWFVVLWRRIVGLGGLRRVVGSGEVV